MFNKIDKKILFLEWMTAVAMQVLALDEKINW